MSNHIREQPLLAEKLCERNATEAAAKSPKEFAPWQQTFLEQRMVHLFEMTRAPAITSHRRAAGQAASKDAKIEARETARGCAEVQPQMHANGREVFPGWHV